MANLKFATMDVFIMTDQPVACPLCRARPDITIEFEEDNLWTQLCKCPDKDCQYLFIEHEDQFLETTHKHEH